MEEMALTPWPAAARVFKLCQCWCRRCTRSISTRGTSWRGCNDERWINNDFTSKQKKIRVKIVGGYNNNTTVITVQRGLNSLYCTAECSLWYGKYFLHVIPLFKRNLSVRKAFHVEEQIARCCRQQDREEWRSHSKDRAHFDSLLWHCNAFIAFSRQ